MSTTFKDEFGKYSKNYNITRPVYPESLYQLIKENCNNFDLAIDVGCGSGQNTIGLSKFFKKVIGYDPSPGQIENGIKSPTGNVEYQVSGAEKIDLPDNSVDLITVATALHWFDLPKFFSETKRLLKPDGVLIIFTYSLLEIVNNDKANQLTHDLYFNTLSKEYWLANRDMVTNGYKDVDTGYENTKRTTLDFTAPTLSINNMLGLYTSWSGYSNYMLKNPNNDPLPDVKAKLMEYYQTDDLDKPLIECKYTLYILISKNN